MTPHSFEASVDAFLRSIAVPRRLREPRVAAALSGIEPSLVPTRWGEVAAWRLGDGPAVLLVHGWEDDNSVWSPLVDELARRGRSLVAFDLPGHGASGGEWAISFEGSDAIRDVSRELGPIDAVVAHSAGCGVAAGAIGEGWTVDRAVFIAPPLASGDRWLRKAERLGVDETVATAARDAYYRVHGPARAAWHPRIAFPRLDVEMLVIHSRDDERNAASHSEDIILRNPRAELVLVDGLTHRRTARDAGVISMIADHLDRPPD